MVELTLAAAARMIHEAVRDKSYRQTPVGTLVARYLRWFRNEWGATPTSVRDYEAVLARMSVSLAHRDVIEVSIDDLRAVIDLWGNQSARTRQKVTSVIRAFWSWAEDEGHIAISPAAKIKRPRAPRKLARPLPLDARPRLLTVAKHPRDRLGLFCLLSLGLRRAELAAVQVRDFDAQRGTLRVYGKGQKERMLPLRGPILAELRLFLSDDLPHVGRPPQPGDYLLYPMTKRLAGRGSEGQAAHTIVAFPQKQPSVQAVWRWFKRLKLDAGLPVEGGLHEARHLFAMELRRVAGIDAASHALGHADLSTTLAIYGHRDDSDLEAAMDAYAAWLERQSSVPPEGKA